MIELTDLAPEVQVARAEYRRLLGYPRGRELEGRAAELAAWARAWYAQNGRPWIHARQAEHLELSESTVRIGGTAFGGERLRRTLNGAGAHSVVLAAVGAGPEIEREAQRLWREEKPDEYFFLEIFGSAVVESLTTLAGARLCAQAEAQGLAVLPHDSPGYPGWELREQQALLERMPWLPAQLEVLESGALRPKKSLLAVFGLTRHTDRLRRLTDLIPCQSCSFSPCQYRRAPYASLGADEASYTVNLKALRRWAVERLTLAPAPGGGVDAVFRYDGVTCTNMGRPLAFQYRVRLGPEPQGYPILEEHCGPADGDCGHTVMCAYLDDGPRLMAAIAQERPLLGQRLSEVLSWPRPAFGAGCYCEPGSRQHKWGLVLETIHFALAQRSPEAR